MLVLPQRKKKINAYKQTVTVKVESLKRNLGKLPRQYLQGPRRQQLKRRSPHICLRNHRFSGRHLRSLLVYESPYSVSLDLKKSFLHHF